MKKGSYLVAGAVLSLSFGFAAGPAAGECTLWRDVVHYDCIEYYPNGTDCKKTRRWVEKVCIQFEVDRGGVDDANRSIRSNSIGVGSGKGIHPGPEIHFVGRLERLKVDGRSRWFILPKDAGKGPVKAVQAFSLDPDAKVDGRWSGKQVRISGELRWKKEPKGGASLAVFVRSIEDDI
jgi:hypothetical protein